MPRSRRTPPGRPASPRYLLLAKVLRPHGIRGEISIQIITNFPDRLRELKKVYLSPSSESPEHLRAYPLQSARPQRATNWLIRLAGIEDRDAADRLREQYVYVSLDEAVPLEADEVYLFQVIGLQVETPRGEILGRVVDLIETGANDVYVVRGSAYGEILIPAIKGVVLSTDVDAGRMIVEPMPGLLPDAEDNPPGAASEN